MEQLIKPIKKTYQSMTGLFFGQILHIKDKRLFMWMKQETAPNSDIKVLLQKIPRSRLVHALN